MSKRLPFAAASVLALSACATQLPAPVVDRAPENAMDALSRCVTLSGEKMRSCLAEVEARFPQEEIRDSLGAVITCKNRGGTWGGCVDAVRENQNPVVGRIQRNSDGTLTVVNETGEEVGIILGQ